MGQIHLRLIHDHVPQLRIEAVVDESAVIRQRVSKEFGCRVDSDASYILNDPTIEAVLICSPTTTHARYIVAAAEANKHIFCEKPLATNVAEAEECVAADVRSQGILQVGFHRRFDPNFVAIRARLLAGDLGRPLIVRISSRDPEPPPPQYPRQAGGFYADSVIHDFDMARFLLGEEPVEVASLGSALCDPFSAASGDIDTAVTILRFASGALATIDNARRSSIGYDQRVELHGTEATARADNVSSLSTVFLDIHGEHRAPFQHFIKERYEEAYKRELLSFAAAIGGDPVVATARDGLAALQLAELAYRSMTEHRTLRLDTLAGQQVDRRVQ